jgi:two-component system, cell cycle sensor histidine kinase and response regulator CckA
MTAILIADDISENRYLLESLFKGNGYDVVSAENGAVALELALKAPPDVIVADILMPVMDGFDLCRQWKTDDRLKSIPFLFYTATYTVPKDEEFALSLGADRFIIKPQLPDVLVRMVREALEESRKSSSAIAGKPLGEEMEVLRQHNEALFRKLERKMLQLQDEIAERKRAEEALQESQMRLLEAHRLAHIGIWDLDRKTDAVIWSEELYRIAGLDSNQAAPSYAEHPRLYTPESWKRLSTAADRALRTQEPYNLELELIRPDGSRRQVIAFGGAKRDGSGQVVGLHGTVQDISERKQAEAERGRLITAIEQAGEMVLVTARDGTIEYVNPAFERVTGYTQQEVIGQSPRILNSGKQDGAFYQELWKTITVGRPWRGRLVNKRKDGSLYTEDATISAVCDAAGEIVNFVAVKRDITEHLKLEEQFLGAQKMEAIGSLAGGVAHDFNNLLSVILGYTTFAIDGVREGDPLREQLVQVRNAGERAAALTRQLLAFSRKQVLEPRVLDLNQIIVNVEKMLGRLLGEDIDFAQVLAPELGRIKADPGQIEQVIMNLVVNARDAMPAGGKLTIETTNVDLDEEYAAQHVAVAPGPHVLLAISDTGCGMDSATLRRAFEPFFTTKPTGKGTGLGLSTVYGIVKQSGGNIWVYSEPGRGTTFKVYLPRISDGIQPEGLLTTDERPVVGTETILLVEDDTPVREIACRLLRASGYNVLAAADGSEALVICEQSQADIHLLLTDVVMPQMSGRQLAERVQRLRPGVPVLYMSGYTDDAVVHHGVLDPGTKFISKPFSAASLARKVREVLDNARSVVADKAAVSVHRTPR